MQAIDRVSRLVLGLSLIFVLVGMSLHAQMTMAERQANHVEAGGGLIRAKEILEEAKRFPQEGVLLDNGEGFVYLKVPDDYIFRLQPFIRDRGFQVPPYFRRPDSPGAHISVFYEQDTRRIKGPIKELGHRFKFTLKRARLVTAHGHDYAIIEVKAPELEKLRGSYGLPGRLLGQDFHISIGRRG